MTPAGALYVVATPIGNLEDLTFRALRILKEVDLIAAEDTRRTAKLLAHYEIRKPLVSLREHNESRETPRLIEKLKAGTGIALVSDAGTPAIADPGARLVRAAREHSIQVVPVPGPSAVTAAVSVSGLASPEFVFMGFPPATGSARRSWFERLSSEDRAVVFFEAPHRIERTLEDAEKVLANRPIHVFREISKIHETYGIRPNKSTSTVKARGEFTLVVETSDAEPTSQPEKVHDLIGRLAKTREFSRDELIEIVSSVHGIPTTLAKKLVKRHVFSGKAQKPQAT